MLRHAPRSPSTGAHLDNAWCLQWTAWRRGGAEVAAPLPRLPTSTPLSTPRCFYLPRLKRSPGLLLSPLTRSRWTAATVSTACTCC